MSRIKFSHATQSLGQKTIFQGSHQYPGRYNPLSVKYLCGMTMATHLILLICLEGQPQAADNRFFEAAAEVLPAMAGHQKQPFYPKTKVIKFG